MATLTVRNIPDDAKHRFRQVAAAHGRSMEEHLRQLVIEAEVVDGRRTIGHVADAPARFTPAPAGTDRVSELFRVADGAGETGGRYAAIRFKTAKDAMAELRRLANGVGLDLPPRLNPTLDAPDF